MKRLALAAFLAIMVHAAAFLVDFPVAPPALVVPVSRAVNIDLVMTHKPKKAPPPKPQENESVRVPTPEPRPAAKTVRPPRPTPLPKRAPTPAVPLKAAPPVALVPEPIQSEPATIPVGAETIPEPTHDDVFSTDEPEPILDGEVQVDTSDDQADIKMSEPLYHLNPPPRYPRTARRRNYQGTVILDVLVTVEGLPAEVRIARSSGYAILDRSAVKTVKGWRFSPARKGRVPVEMWVQVPVRFELR